MKPQNSNTRAILICAGEASRWANYLDTPKHLIEIEGERLLDRTVRLLRERGVQDIHVVVKQISPAYQAEGAEQYVAKLNPENKDADKFLSSSELWNPTGRTIVFYGDCYYTEDAMDTILDYSGKDWHLFCRRDASDITGTPWGECFAYVFYSRHFDLFRTKLEYVRDLFKAGTITRCGGWELYRALTGREGRRVLRPHTMTTNWTNIDDWTDDFDYPKDYETWMERRRAAVL